MKAVDCCQNFICFNLMIKDCKSVNKIFKEEWKASCFRKKILFVLVIKDPSGSAGLSGDHMLVHGVIEA